MAGAKQSKKLNLDDLSKRDMLTEEEQKLIAEGAYSDNENIFEEDENVEEEQEEENDSEEESSDEDDSKSDVEEEEAGDEDSDAEEADDDDESSKGKEDKSDEDLLNAEEADLTKDELKKRQELLDKKILDTEDEELSKKELARKKELLKESKSSEEKSLEDRIKEYANQYEISEEDAKDEIEQIDKIKSRYDGDLDEISRSNLYLQRMVSKTKAQLKETQEASKIQEMTPEKLDKLVKSGQFIVDTPQGKRALGREELIKLGRTNSEWSKIADSLDDDQLYELVINDLAKNQSRAVKQQKEKFKQKASEKRIEAIKDLANYNNKFYKEAKAIIQNIDDRFIASDSFNVKHIITQVKGEHYDKDIEDIGKKRYQEGLERGKILDNKPKEGRSKKSKSKRSFESYLNEQQKKEALNMFESADVSDDKKFEMYLNVYPEVKKQSSKKK